jgi:uncharacterized membrane-anchored protein YhcB (DUF1043 family)
VVVDKIVHFLKTLIIGIVAGFIIAFSLFRKTKNTTGEYELEQDEENRFESKAELAKKETTEKLSHIPACDIADQYDAVCDTITEGKQRFSSRAKRVLQSRRSKSDDQRSE